MSATMEGSRKLRVVVAICAVALTVAALLSPLGAQGAGGKVYFPSKCMNAKYQPHLVVLGCADFGFYLNKLHWKHWDQPTATGRGKAHVNDCMPDCTEGTFHKYRGKLRLTNVKSCPQDGKLHYTKAEFRFRGDRPSGYPHSFKQPFPCSLSG